MTVRGTDLSSSWRALRRRLLTPNVSETSLDKRGFHKKSPDAQERLETVGKTFLEGYAYSVEARTADDAVDAIEQRVPDWLKGFAYEGAGMGLAVLDGLPFGRSDNVDRFLATERGEAYRYLIYVGIGWAMARIPRFRWPKEKNLDQLLVPLVLDGYGFHQAYFSTKKYIDGQYQDPRFSWGGPHANAAMDAGIGRAAWFIRGTDPDLVADLIDSFPEHRRANLYAGVGLAATYAGGPDGERDLRILQRRAGGYLANVAQGSAFAIDARVRSGIVPEHSALATKIFWDATPEEVAKRVTELRPAGPDGDLPGYEVWRQRLANEFGSNGGVNS
jgi:enediyne biosynthesis protein E3